MFACISLTKQYEDGQVAALHALNVTVKPGEIFFLPGANGAGKCFHKPN
jgi:ABC-2 type transport system ATP-binding protein